MRLPAASAVLEGALADGTCPAASAVVLVRGRPVHASAAGRAQVTPAPRALCSGDPFDLASLTKPYVASAGARLVERGLLALDQPAAELVPALGRGEKAAITLRHLLAHSSGLPAWRPWHERVAADPLGAPAFLPPGARPPASALAGAFRRGRTLFEAALEAEPLEAPPGARARYSDLGFIALGFALERAGGVRLDQVVAREVLAPLGLDHTSFLPADRPPPGGAGFAATRRSAARGGEVLCGVVDDDNAWALGGVAGHAGLFAPAGEVAAFGQAWLDALGGRSAWLGAETARCFTARDTTPGSERTLGWDTPSPRGSALGERLGRGRAGAVGHLGFTGTSLWLDLDRALVCALLTNHVHPAGADRARLRGLRAAFHDAVAADLGFA